MQIFFTTSKQTVHENRVLIEKILKLLESKGHKVSLRSKIFTNDKDSSGNSGINFIPIDEPITSDSIKEVFLTNQKKILTCDLVICEMSHTSTGIGYDVAHALIANKPVLVLSKEKSELTETVTGNSSKRLWIKTYNEDNISEIIDNFVKEARKMIDSKFILIIPPEIEQYLNWASNKKGIRKAEIVRTAIEKHMETDIDYKKYISDIEN